MNYYQDSPTNREEILTALRSGEIALMFIKADESRRTIYATLQGNLIEETEKKTERTKTPNPDVQSVWDTEAAGWRSFRWDRLQHWAVVVAPEEMNLV